ILPFQVGFGGVVLPANGVSGSLSAQGTNTAVDATAGGGTISVINNGPGGIILNDSLNVNVSTLSGDGGTVSLTTAGAISFSNSRQIDVSAHGQGLTGGTIILSGTSITTLNLLTLTANAAGSGSGGVIKITETGAASDIHLSSISAPNTFAVQANGGSLFA